MNPSPLRYPGGKYKLYKYVCELVQINHCSTYIEPFCGGAGIAFELLKNNVVKNIVINDYDYSIYCFWDSVLHRTDEFIDMIKSVDVSMEEWHRQKTIRDNLKNYDPLEVGFSTFFLNRTNRSGIIDKAGPIGGMDQNGNYPIDCRFNKIRLVEQIREIAAKRNNIRLYNLEALEFIDQVILKTRNSFVFFDPPYYSKGAGLYTNFYCHGDHANLANEIVTKLRNRKWIVSYDNVNEIKSMYQSVDELEFVLRYSLQNKKAGNEVMFFSKNIIRPIHENRYIQVMEKEG